MRLATAQMDYTGTSREMVLDTTFRSAEGLGTLLAPTKKMVYNYKYFGYTWARYQSEYLSLIQERYTAQPETFKLLAQQQQLVVVKCYCNAHVRPHCHRYLLVGVFEQLCGTLGLNFEYVGEVK